MATKLETVALPPLLEGWEGEKNFKAVGKLSHATQRAIAPVGAHFLAEARRVMDPFCRWPHDTLL